MHAQVISALPGTLLTRKVKRAEVTEDCVVLGAVLKLALSEQHRAAAGVLGDKLFQSISILLAHTDSLRYNQGIL